jgi:HAD superfamily hydrolase (TIGR01459 family)
MTQDRPTAAPRLDIGLAELAAAYDVLLCDVWGVVHNGVVAHGAAVDALCRFRRAGGVVILITNAPAPRAQVARRLASLEVPTDAYDDIATSGDVTAALIAEAGCPPLYAIGPQDELAIYEEAARLGPRRPPLATLDEAELAICVGLDPPDETPDAYDPVLHALRRRDLAMICANPDIVVEMGQTLKYCAGAIAERYAALGGRVVQAGKPFPAIYDRALSMAAAVRAAVPLSRVLAIGDAAHTDLVGARTRGIDALFVTHGIHRDELHPHGTDQGLDETVLARLYATHAIQPLAAVAGLSWHARS